MKDCYPVANFLKGELFLDLALNPVVPPVEKLDLYHLLTGDSKLIPEEASIIEKNCEIASDDEETTEGFIFLIHEKSNFNLQRFVFTIYRNHQLHSWWKLWA
jgi:hypothetical protein